MERLREMTSGEHGERREEDTAGREYEHEVEEEEEGDLRRFQKRLYTDEAYECLQRECYKRVWSVCFDGEG